ncbi:MAG: sulfite exporter TauE/SafE family protein [Bacilli bacterium]|nr:sulfite exporter TauE/SafE family protein [Bacilli bacterium]
MTILEIIFVLVAFLSNIIQTITGFAGTALAMPFSIRLVGYDIARQILNFIPILVSLVVVVVNFKSINWKRLVYMLLFVGIGFGLGTSFQFLPLNKTFLMRVYGTIICLIAITNLFIKIDANKIPKIVFPFILVVAGVIHALYTSGGPLIVIFAASVITEKNEFRATLSLMWILFNSITFGINIAHGQFTPHVWMMTGIVTLTTILAMLIGKMIVKKINREMFMKISYMLLFISGMFAVI